MEYSRAGKDGRMTIETSKSFGTVLQRQTTNSREGLTITPTCWRNLNSSTQDVQHLHGNHDMLRGVLICLVEGQRIIAQIAATKADFRTDTSTVDQELEFDPSTVWASGEHHGAVVRLRRPTSVRVECQLHIPCLLNSEHWGGHTEVPRKVPQFAPGVGQTPFQARATHDDVRGLHQEQHCDGRPSELLHRSGSSNLRPIHCRCRSRTQLWRMGWRPTPTPLGRSPRAAAHRHQQRSHRR
mmetsp:Transcript_52688/g.150900  ORF Transcript_52688/g.150900 Transcript_52688/m.150900 type:complete len:240 (+) Transcript_52688:113-832(+)